jgi:hypothetical protein
VSPIKATKNPFARFMEMLAPKPKKGGKQEQDQEGGKRRLKKGGEKDQEQEQEGGKRRAKKGGEQKQEQEGGNHIAKKIPVKRATSPKRKSTKK